MRVKQYDEDLDLETTEVQSLKQKMGSGPLNTDAQQVIPAINEIKSSLSDLDFTEISSQLTFSGYYVASHDNFKVFKNKVMMVLAISLQINVTVPANTAFITGFPTNLAISPSLGALVDLNKDAYEFRLTSEGKLQNDVALPTGWYTGNMTVILNPTS